MSAFAFWSAVASLLVAVGLGVMLLADDRIRRVLGLNVAASGTIVVLLTVAAREPGPDPVLHALALTGVVVTIAFTGLAIVLARRLDEMDAEAEADAETEIDAEAEGEPAANDASPSPTGSDDDPAADAVSAPRDEGGGGT